MMHDDPLGLSLPPASGAANLVRQWAREAWRVDEATEVSVCEIRCAEPGCPPRETVILLRHPDGATQERRFHKAMGELVLEDLMRLPLPGQ